MRSGYSKSDREPGDGVTGAPVESAVPGNGPTVIEAVRLAERYLETHGIESPRLSAEHLLAKALGCTRLDLYLRFDERPAAEALDRYREDLKVRAKRYPLQYLLGEIGFMGLRFRVSPGVFIPRPETELLVEWIEELTGDRLIRFLEFGTGTGVIAGALAARHRGWTGAAFDISPRAARLAGENMEALGVRDRIGVFAADGFDAVWDGASFDLVVANPPYVPSAEIPALQHEVSGHEDRNALEGGPHGTDFYPVIAAAGSFLLVDGGMLAVEIGDGQAAFVTEALAHGRYERISVRRDYNGFERMVTAFRPQETGGG